MATGRGSLSGRITQANGTAVPDATIIITDTAGNSQRMVTGADGGFTLVNLPPGTYRVEVETGGARRMGRQTVTITENAPAQIEVAFDEPGTVAITGSTSIPLPTGFVEIQAIAPTIQNDSAEVARAYHTRTVRSLPVLDRQYQELIGLMPGVTPPIIERNQIIDPQRRRSFHVNGLPDWANIYHQDGGVNTESFLNQVSRVTPNEAIQQLNVRTSNYNAEHGWSGGAWTNVVTRPGTNRVHGSLFGFHTNNFFAARNPLVPGNQENPRFNQNQFGGTAGLPIIKDRMFLFGSYEGFLRRGSTLDFATVPTADFRSGNFSGISGLQLFNPGTGTASGANRTPVAGNQLTSGQISPFARAILPFIPQPNQPGLVNNLIGGVPLVNDTHRFDGKIDHRFTESTTGFFRYGFTHGDIDRGSLLGVLGDAANSSLRNHDAVAAISANYTPTFLAEYRFGFSRYNNRIAPAGNFGALNTALAGAGFAGGLPQINISGFSSLGYPGNFPSKNVNNSYNPAANFQWHTGIHRLRFGAEARLIDASGFTPGFFSPLGTFSFTPGATANPATFNPANLNLAAQSWASFLFGAPTQAGISSFNTTPTWRQTQYAGYITDTLNLWQWVHLELGVRYDVFSPIEPRRAGGAQVFNPNTNTITPVGTGGLNIYGNQEYDLNNIAPRVGLVIQPFSRLAIRAGYGFHYFPVPFALSGINPAATGLQAGIAGGFTTAQLRLPTQTGTGTPNQPFYVTQGDQQTPYVQTYSLMVQGDLGAGFLLDLSYVGNSSRHLPFSRSLNVALPGSGSAGLPFGNRTALTVERATGLNANYNSAQVNLTKRFSAGLAFAGSYTFSKALDRGFDLINPFDRDRGYGPADWDRRHILAVSHVWNLPFGPGTRYFNSGPGAWILGNWEINGILRWASGSPYTVFADPLACACPGFQQIPATLVGRLPESNQGSSTFDPSLFSAPAANSFGNLGRNALRGPDLFTYNVALFRNFNIMENIKLEFRGEAYNVTNTSNFSNPVSFIGQAGFGRPISTFNGIGGRQFQVGARLLF